MEKSDFIFRHRIDRDNRCMRIPLFVHIEVTTRCNVGCPQCYCSSTSEGKDMDFLLYKEIIEQIDVIKIPSILLTGGEPILHIQLIQMIEYAAQKNINVIVSTSGVGINENFCKKLAQSGIGEVCVSINGSNKYIHSLSRGHFESAVNALKLLADHNINLRVNWVARGDNYRDFPNVVDLCIQNKINKITILSNKKRDGIIYSPMKKPDVDLLNKYIEENKNKIHIDVDPCFNELLKLNTKNMLKVTCNAGITFFDILVDGGMLPCRHILSDRCCLNNLSVEEYWHSESLQNFRNAKPINMEICK